MSRKNALPAVALAFGIMVGLFGMLLIGAYVSQAVVARIGEPDQSLLFWYSPFLTCGVMALISGLGIAALGFVLLRPARRSDPSGGGAEPPANTRSTP
jgi:hypothetical protein